MTALARIEWAEALLESRAAQRRYRRAQEAHFEKARQAIEHDDEKGAARHLVAAMRLGDLALLTKLREPRP